MMRDTVVRLSAGFPGGPGRFDPEHTSLKEARL